MTLSMMFTFAFTSFRKKHEIPAALNVLNRSRSQDVKAKIRKHTAESLANIFEYVNKANLFPAH